MKGLQEQTESKKVFLLVKHGSICQESKTPIDGYESITVNNPKTGQDVTKFIKRYRCVEGLVTSLEWYDTEDKYDQRYTGWKIHLNAAGTQCVLDLPFGSRACNRFMKCAENIDYTQPVEFAAWLDAEKATAFIMRQDEKNVPQVYTKENPGDCPPPVQSRTTKKWNFDAQADWLCERIYDQVIPKIEAAANPVGTDVVQRAKSATAGSDADSQPASIRDVKAKVGTPPDINLADVDDEDIAF